MTDNTTTPGLPDLSDAAIARIESAVFDEIESERPPARVAERSRARRRGWLTGVGIAAAFVVGVLATPPILSAVGGSDSFTAVGEAQPLSDGTMPMSGGAVADTSAERAPLAGADSALPGAASDAGREIISTANATVEVEDVADAVAEISALAEAHGGYAESTDVGKSTSVYGTEDSLPADSGYGWISIRIPSAELPAVIDELADTGDILSSSISRQDVTSTSIDLKARVEALTASVQRLTELMSQSGSVSELIEAEVALTDRQAELQSYQQQLDALEDQVAMSTLQVQLTSPAAVPTADPAGFGDGLAAGWNGLVVSLNALVIALGFIIPWAAVAAVILLLVRWIRRTRRNRRAAEAAQKS
ncbi:DUF4349 domain-containing protein [Microbacterium sp.]|uniref:DUF4349 domain-containing protein n=1 Tax=Microbacterium sp. TaxID=51671 RepID=UPI0039E59F42